MGELILKGDKKNSIYKVLQPSNMWDALDEFVFIGNGCSYLVYLWWRLPFCGTPGKKQSELLLGMTVSNAALLM